MKIRSFYTLQNGVYKAALNTEDWSEGDTKLMQKFGEPEIDKGGDFTIPPDTEFTLPEELVRIASDSPITQSFDSRDSADAEEMAIAWGAEIIVRITAAVTALRAMTDDYTREEVTNV